MVKSSCDRFPTGAGDEYVTSFPFEDPDRSTLPPLLWHPGEHVEGQHGSLNNTHALPRCGRDELVLFSNCYRAPTTAEGGQAAMVDNEGGIARLQQDNLSVAAARLTFRLLSRKQHGPSSRYVEDQKQQRGYQSISAGLFNGIGPAI